MAFTFTPVVLDGVSNNEQANSYVDVSWADSYFTDHYQVSKATTWAGLTTGQKQRALVAACSMIEKIKFTIPTDRANWPNLRWDNINNRFYYGFPALDQPVKYNVFQRLQFPRNKDIYANGQVYMSERVMEAQCEQAIYLVQLDPSVVERIAQGVVQDVIQAEGVTISKKYDNTKTSQLCPIVREWLTPLSLRTWGRLTRA